MKRMIMLAAVALAALGLRAAEPLVEYPYVSIYYSDPTALAGEKVELGYFVTDWHNSRIRLGDDSRRFDVMLKYGPAGGPYRTLTQRNVGSGDHTFSFGPFGRGDYECFIWAKDLANGLESHRVLHEFRVRTKDELAIPEAKTYRMTEADLAAYGIVPEVGLYSRVFVETADKTVKLSVTNLPPDVTAPEDGYVVLVPSEKGKVRHDTWKTKAIAYGPKWDAAKVAATAAANTAGIRRLIGDKAAAGFRKVVLPKGLYRVAHEPSITVPSHFTLDLNGATLKLNGFKGHGCWIVQVDGYDSHLVNGTIEGDYYEHDYKNSEHGSEWVNGVNISGDSRYSSVENMAITHITGYGTTVLTRGTGTYEGCKAGVGMMGKPTDGALDLKTGEVKPAPGRFTGQLVDISSFGTNHLLCVSHRLDAIRGLVSRSWYSTVAFYDADKKFISGEVAFLYRPLLIPPGAKFVRVTVECATRKDARWCDLSVQLFREPALCAFRNNRFHLNRSTAHVPFVSREILCADNVFDHCGETLTHCAIDAEDGWEGLHDYYLMRNRFTNTPNADVILNAGQNLVVDGNTGSVTIRSRVISPCVRNNTLTYARFSSGGVEKKLRPGHEHSMHARYENNVYRGPLFLGEEAVSDGWTVALSGVKVGRPEGKPTTVRIGPGGRIHRSSFVNCYFNGSIRAERCAFDNCSFTYNGSRGHWKDCVINGSTFLWSTSNRFDRCELNGSVFHVIGNGYIGMNKCKLRNTTSHFQYWQPPTKIHMVGCDVKGTNSLWNVGRYTLGRFVFRDTSFDLGKSAVVCVCDARKTKTDDNAVPAITLADRCTFKSPLYAQTSKSECTSERPTVFALYNCDYPKGLPMGTQAKKQAHWQDLIDDEWTAYRKAQKAP